MRWRAIVRNASRRGAMILIRSPSKFPGCWAKSKRFSAIGLLTMSSDATMPAASGSNQDTSPRNTGTPATLKHALRTPLNHIVGYCEMLIEEAEDNGPREFMSD